MGESHGERESTVHVIHKSWHGVAFMACCPTAEHLVALINEVRLIWSKTSNTINQPFDVEFGEAQCM